jgi:hypothetical protein
VARFGPPDAEAVLWINSATHGVEGFCGSGVQIGMMAQGWHRRRPPNVALLLTHAINPHGFAWIRRVTEDNVDLNRNFGPPGVPPPVNAGVCGDPPVGHPGGHRRPAPCRGGRRAGAVPAAAWGPRLHQAMAGGQYAYPDGVFYGGTGPTWSNRLLHALIDTHLAQARRFCFLDIHTGWARWGMARRVMSAGRPTRISRNASAGSART